MKSTVYSIFDTSYIVAVNRDYWLRQGSATPDTCANHGSGMQRGFIQHAKS